MKLLDNYGRVIKDLRISVTPRCNLHCLYCHPLGLEMREPPGTLTVEEVDRFLEAASLLGLSSVRFTGGEPLVRKELPEMIARARAKEGVEDVAITTNGLLFARRAKELVEAGLNRVNISLDALTPEVFARITRGGKVERVLEAIEKAGLTPEDIRLFVPHQANLRIIDAARERLGLPWERVAVNVDRYGNTSTASIPLALKEAVDAGRIREGDHVLLVSFGAGLTWAAAVLTWGGA